MSKVLIPLTDKNIATNGYQKLDSGLIIQWGRSNGGSNAVVEGVFTFDFPVAFPNACLSFVPTDYVSESSALCTVGAGSNTNATTAEVYYKNDNGNTSANPGFINWIAIGW